jgi:hypothetical protein
VKQSALFSDDELRSLRGLHPQVSSAAHLFSVKWFS